MNKLSRYILGYAVSVAFLAMIPSVSQSAGGKNRLGDEDIEEGYLLCKRAGVLQVEITSPDGEVVVVLDCIEVPMPGPLDIE